ncbi:alanine--tRNA ligase [Psychroflexus planctonicus]|uniref:Alanine--tRNA ligase n=1 Tax=Psychroflexus planctonicus TaxID=1526575 RepID=A0ABQ1SDJ6_9FLAO|nr:alanine--tRNA ligase [Psychroflexus planctonicus]GGE24841.1 alanine--tRNA ligase [Psychroflexus planctonicus]
MKSQEIRQRFLNFFENKSHVIVPSAPMVLKDDPTLMFTNAGMNQFKEYFLGNSTPKHHQLADTQKCLRVSGKHNDLEEVGKDTYHHTMFEMLGNWSIGDPKDASVGYFKKEAIEWAWEFLTEELKIDKSTLYVTVFEGDQQDGIAKDDEAFQIWKNIVDEDKILLGNKKDNFWEMGDQGPCGPASEIHVDIRSPEEKTKTPGKDLVNQDHPQVVEIWNLVFIQYNRLASGKLQELPAKHIDTGMGFERLSMVMQGVQSNYDTDVFTPLLSEIETITGHTYAKNEATDIAMRVIADHVRAVTFAIADGQLPSSTGAGYVIRRILRRAIRYGFTFLDTKEAFIYKLVKVLVFQMSEAFPELKKQRTLCENVIQEEENSFLRTLAQGLSLLDQMVEKNKGKELPGEKAFELYDTYGFPVDLTSLILEEKGMTLNEEAFQKSLQAQKDRSKNAAASKTGDWEVLQETENEEFIGYDRLQVEVELVKYRKITSQKDGELYQLVFNQTPFYPEGGGQVGDKGYIESANGDVTYITDTKKENNLIVHFSKELPQQPEKKFTAVVDQKHRELTARNHTATHLLHQALRVVLGTHVEQKGSLVNAEYLRFDFSHFSKLTDDEVKQVEAFVNARIQEQLPLVENRNISYQQAIENGAIALFGEKYGDQVRTINFGKSTELCGGTHVKNTSELWHFIIIQETSVASGIRRIEAITSNAAKNHLTDKAKAFDKLRRMLNNSNEPEKVLQNLHDENFQLKKEIENLKKAQAKNLKGDLKSELQGINGIHFLAKQVDLDANGMKDLAFQLAGEVNNLFLVLGAEVNGKAVLTCYIDKKLAKDKQLNAGQIVRELGKHIQGGGGGQPFFATAGGKNPHGIADALKEAKKYIS